MSEHNEEPVDRPEVHESEVGQESSSQDETIPENHTENSQQEPDPEPQEIQSPNDPNQEKYKDDPIVDVSPAFRELSDLQERGIVSPFKAAKLWSKYKDAFQMLESKRKHGEDLLLQVNTHKSRLQPVSNF